MECFSPSPSHCLQLKILNEQLDSFIPPVCILISVKLDIKTSLFQAIIRGFLMRLSTVKHAFYRFGDPALHVRAALYESLKIATHLGQTKKMCIGSFLFTIQFH